MGGVLQQCTQERTCAFATLLDKNVRTADILLWVGFVTVFALQLGLFCWVLSDSWCRGWVTAIPTRSAPGWLATTQLLERATLCGENLLCSEAVRGVQKVKESLLTPM